jgi:hypothetical protein
MLRMIEIAGPRTLVAFDGRVLELFGNDRSRRIHVDQILSAEIQHGQLLVDDGAVLSVRLTDGQRVTVPFAASCGPELEHLVTALGAGAELRPI